MYSRPDRMEMLFKINLLFGVIQVRSIAYPAYLIDSTDS